MDNISNLIYTIRDKQVMLDRDLAKLYECLNGTKTINQAVVRHKERFPKDFCFQLTKEEYNILKSKKDVSKEPIFLRSQFGTSKIETRGGRQYMPYVFTEQGVAMLASVLRTSKASEVSVHIMRTFVEMRKFIIENKNIFERVIVIENQVANKFIEYDNNFDKIFNEMQKEEMKEKIFYEGQIYDAYSLLIDIIRRAKKEIVIIDNYVDKSMLDILTKKKEEVEVLIIGSNRLKLKKIDIEKFNEQYPRIRIEISDKYHDRFIIIDKEEIYHLGSSIKDLGKRCFGINKLEDKLLIDKLIKEVIYVK